MAIVVLELEVLARHLDLVIVGTGCLVVVLYHRDHAKHPHVQLLSEGSQDRHFGSPQISEVTKPRGTRKRSIGNFKQCGIQG